MQPKKISSLWLITALALTFSIVSVTGASADSGSATFVYLIGTDFLCGFPDDARGPACPDVSIAADGATIEMTGSGTLSIHPKSVTGGGVFTHKDSAGNVLGSGSWTATQLLSFRSYGTQPDFPPTFEGGLAVIRVQLFVDGTPVADGVLQVDCAVGNFPPSSEDGVRLAVRGGPNFNEELSGFTLFIRQ